MLSKKSKIEQLPKSRERQCLPAAASASLCQARTKLCGHLLVIRGGPSHRRARHAPAALKNLVHLSEKPFSTASVNSIVFFASALRPLILRNSPRRQTWRTGGLN